MTTIAPKKTLYVDYPVPPTQRVLVRVAASEAVNVYVMDKAMLDGFLEQKPPVPSAIGVSQVSANHTMQVRLPLVERWYLVIDNPWDRPVDAEYTVIALAPMQLSDFAGQTVTSSLASHGDPLTIALSRRRRLAK